MVKKTAKFNYLRSINQKCFIYGNRGIKHLRKITNSKKLALNK